MTNIGNIEFPCANFHKDNQCAWKSAEEKQETIELPGIW